MPVVPWFILLSLICVSASSDVVWKGRRPDQIQLKSGQGLVFEYKYCLLDCEDQNKDVCLKYIRRGMNIWTQRFINNELKKYDGRELKLTPRQDLCERGDKGDPSYHTKWGYSVHKEIDLVINFVRGDPFTGDYKNDVAKYIPHTSPKEILFNDNYTFLLHYIKRVTGHFVGRFLGLGAHTNDEGSIMCLTCDNTNVNEHDRDSLIKIFKDKSPGEESLQNMLEDKEEEIDFLRNIHLTVLPDYMYTTQHAVHFILDSNMWSYAWDDVPLQGTPHKQDLHRTMPSELADMITDVDHIGGVGQSGADVVFQLSIHHQHFTFVILHNRVKMFDGHTVTELQLSNREELLAQDDRISSVLIFPKHKELALFSQNHYYILDTEKWYSRPSARRLLHLKKRHYNTENEVMRRVKLVYYVYPGDFSIFQAYDENFYLGTYQITLSKVFSSTMLSLQQLEVHQVQLPDLLHSEQPYSS